MKFSINVGMPTRLISSSIVIAVYSIISRPQCINFIMLMRYASNLKGHIHAQSIHILYFNRLNPLRQISGNKHGRAARAQSRTEPTYLERPKMADTSQADRARLTIMPGAAIVSGFLKEAET